MPNRLCAREGGTDGLGRLNGIYGAGWVGVYAANCWEVQEMAIMAFSAGRI